MMKRTNTRKQGIATLPAVMILAAMALAVAVSVTTISLTESFSSQSSQYSGTAQFYAEGGARDALTKIARDKNYVCSTTDCYTVPFVANGCVSLDGCAKVSVSAGVGTVGDPKIIISKGQRKTSTRTLQVSVVLDASDNGQISTATWSEL